MSSLHDLAASVGLQIDWQDAAGRAQTVSNDNLQRILNALGYPAGDDRQIAQSLSQRTEETRRCRFVSAKAGTPFLLPDQNAEAAEATLTFENGGSETLVLERAEGGLCCPAIDTTGYHTLTGSNLRLTIAIAPPRCLDVNDFAPGQRLWGPAVQIPALRDGDGRAFGDFGSLADSARRFAEAGADILAISPTHALFPADPTRFSPYAPSSRAYLNVMFGDPALAGQSLSSHDTPELIDWETAIPARMLALRAAYQARDESLESKLQAYRQRKGQALELQATYDALHAHFFATGARSWHGWPEEYHDAHGAAVGAFGSEHCDEVGFFVFAQWLAEESLDAAQQAATQGGMAIGLIADLAVGMDGGGSHAWARGDELLQGLSIGAPPDLLGPDGQDWGLTSFSPEALQRTAFSGFVATVRAALEHAGGIRVDHALGLNRLWVIPHGGTAADGAYLKYPLDDFLNILAIESHRANAIVIGEDLGTVPDGLRPKLEAAHVLGMRVLPFERDWTTGHYTPPADWQKQAVAMTGTHDLPTIAGWWQGRDIDWGWALGRSSSHDNEQAERHARADERASLWDALTQSGATAGQQPDIDASGPVLDATLRHTGMTPCQLAIVPLEDIIGLTEQPNLPGTTDEHPNWRRRMPKPTGDLLADPVIARRVDILNESRK